MSSSRGVRPATDPIFAQDPVPVVRGIAQALAALHCGDAESSGPPEVITQTPVEVEAALTKLRSGAELPHPYERNTPDTLAARLEELVALDTPPVLTHGTPVVAAAMVDAEGAVELVERGSWGWDPPERDLAIAFRSVAESFAPEAAGALLEAYVDAGGQDPDGHVLDGYALLAAWR